MRASAWLLPTLLLAACDPSAPPPEDVSAVAGAGQALTAAEQKAIVDALNDVRTTTASLRAASVSSTAARNLMAHRDGRDARPGTSDDDRFDSFAEVDAVSGVGPATLERLNGYAQRLGYGGASATGGSWDGARFTAAEAEATLAAANSASRADLIAAGILERAADSIIAARPIPSMDALAAVPNVGRATLEALRTHALGTRPSTRPDLNAATEAQLEACNGVGPSIASALVDYRRTRGAFETYDEVRALPSLGWSLPINDTTIAGLRACTVLTWERRTATATVDALIADPAAYEGAVVALTDVVMTRNLTARATATMQVFDFARWGHRSWDATGVPASAKLALAVEPAPEMQRRASTTFEPKAARDTMLNRVNLVGLFEVRAGAPRLRVRSATAPGRDYIQVVSRWVYANRVTGLASLWSKENGVVQVTDGAFVNLVPAPLLNAHPAILWHVRTTGERVDVGRYQTGYDGQTNPFSDRPAGGGRYRQIISAWIAAGRP